MDNILNITSGDIAGATLAKSGVPGEVLVWHDILYDGPRMPGWPDQTILLERAEFLENFTGKGLSKQYILQTLQDQYAKLETAAGFDGILLWFDACLFDQSMLCHILACLRHLRIDKVDLICLDACPGIDPFHGLGQLSPEQFASIIDLRKPVSQELFCFAERVDQAFATKDQEIFTELSGSPDAPIPWIPAAVKRWLAEQLDPKTGLGLLEKLALEAIASGCTTPAQIFEYVSKMDTPPNYWGDTTLWVKINGLAERQPPLVRIEGPMTLLPQWQGIADLKLFRLHLTNVS